MRPIFGFSSCAARSRSSPCDRSAARSFTRIWATWIAESLGEGFRPRLLARDQRRQALGEPCNRDALLLRGVALADRHRAIVQRLEVDSDTERRADLALTAVSPPDGAPGLGVLDAEPALQR